MFKSNFTRICTDKGISPSRVLTDLGYSSSVYSEWTETTVPRNKTLVKIAEYLGVTIDDLLNEKPSNGIAAVQVTPQEQSLLDAFRSLPPATQAALLALVQTWEGDGRKQYP